MASSKAEPLDPAKEIKNVCPICFESFKTPRYLPCFHTFCHNCLSSYILSTCKSKENPVGFPCPLCRQFVPAPSSIGEPEKWTELIPINTIVKTICEKKDQFCDACRRTEEEEVATDWYHNAPAKYLCVDHEELCCGECVCTKHRKCNQVDEIEKTAENLIQSGTLKKLAQEIQKHNEILIQTKTDGETTMKHIDETADKISQETTDLRDKLVRHINGLVETHLDDLAKKVKGIKEKLAKFDDTVTDRQLLMTQYSQVLTDTEKTPPPILVQNYLKIKRQFKHVTGLCLNQPSVKLHSEASKQLSTILDTFGLADVKVEVKYIPIGRIDLTCADMKLVCELSESGAGDIFGGCFLENGDIVLADSKSFHCLYYSNGNLVRKITVRGYARDVVYRNPSELLISSNVQNLEGNTVEQIAVDKDTYSVAVNKQEEIISSSCDTHQVTVRNQS
uniref:E3 ubiquitin-protein ligase TRIM31-like n=1 Tax=Crassostrea virginica TaxID=6565 RepID=A0A8B8BQ67_CRAVI|nr:E3 ubiquitin-protein ligase TRIM31-like [Crassostrea virginica]